MAAVRRPGYDQATRMLAGGRLLDDAAKVCRADRRAWSARGIASRRPQTRAACSRRCHRSARHAYVEIAGRRSRGVPGAAGRDGARHFVNCRQQGCCPCLTRARKKRPAGQNAYIAPPVQRAVRLIRHVAEGNPVLNMSETAKALKINRTTLLRLLHTLEAEGFVERRPSGEGYQVGSVVPRGRGARAVFAGSRAGRRPDIDQACGRTAAFGPSRHPRRHAMCSISCAARPIRRSPATSASAAGCRRMPPRWAGSSSRSCPRSRSNGSSPARSLSASPSIRRRRCRRCT